MADVHGFCDERFQPLRDLLQGDLGSGVDEGAAFSVSSDGESVVDLWGGYRDRAHTKNWEADTIVLVFSTSKVVVAIATLMLWDRGLLDLDAPIATYWPEFAQNGKAAITTRHVLVHSSGLPGFGCVPTSDDIRDWDRMVAMTERAPAWYESGTTTCYHGATFGYILGEVVHRISGSPFAQFTSEEITGPLGADFRYAMSAPRDLARLAEVRRPPSETAPELSPLGLRVAVEMYAMVTSTTEADFLSIVSPGGNGHTNARALARIGSIIALGGEVDGRRYLSREAVDEAAREQSFAEDQAMGVRVRRGLHFGLHSDTMAAPTPTTIHWGGLGGSWLTMDPASGISCAYTPNRLLIGDRLLVRQTAQWQTLSALLPNLG